MSDFPDNITQHFYTMDDQVPLTLRSTCRSVRPYKAHRHAELSVGAIVDGQTCVHFNDRYEILNPGDVVIIPPEVVHACNPVEGKPRSYHMLYIDPDWLCALNHLSSLHFGTSLTVLKSAGLFRQYLTIVDTITHPSLTGKMPERVRSFCQSMIASLCDDSASPEMQVSGEEPAPETNAFIRQVLMTQISSPPSLDELSGKFQLCPETIIRRFSRDYGMTPKAFINNLRVEEGKKLLRAGYSIADTALTLGFSDQSHFHKAFVQYAAATPNQYRQMMSIFDNKS
ncbi:HTH-type transcriptional activator RhaS [Vibrio aerogenes CECT 7868]|uniref:HTH-type transcriptional activator RhaS n=1 Tax=Vibrio aerogenes CECT 7868 TaxID=1216006 RepID=A0A1M6C5K5_9VIBR|nr:AraC family transcriptional regulator [Vibrio aerogenes]SHI56024.1 HTH-type transcriptional activator RhaS [Vibrio aerogenes CECT 7868]